MSESTPPAPEHDPSAELGLRNPVRDQERIGDQKYSVTPPRSKVSAPQDHESGAVACRACNAELAPAESYRIDAEEYVYHFCSAECYAHWRSDEDRKGAGAP